MSFTDRSGINDWLLMENMLNRRAIPGFGNLGINWSLTLQVAGYIIQGIGLGMSVYDAIKGAQQETGAKAENFSESDMSQIAKLVAAQDPQGRSESDWLAMLQQNLKPLPAPMTCPPGTMPDPSGSYCMEIKKGFLADIPSWALVAGGVGGLLLLKKMKVF